MLHSKSTYASLTIQTPFERFPRTPTGPRTLHNGNIFFFHFLQEEVSVRLTQLLQPTCTSTFCFPSRRVMTSRTRSSRESSSSRTLPSQGPLSCHRKHLNPRCLHPARNMLLQGRICGVFVISCAVVNCTLSCAIRCVVCATRDSSSRINYAYYYHCN